MKSDSSSLSRLARDLLTAERDHVEPAALKGRAMARAHQTLQAERQSGVGMRASASRNAWRGASRARRVAVAVAAALAMAGIAAAGVTWQRSLDITTGMQHGIFRRVLGPLSQRLASRLAAPVAPAAPAAAVVASPRAEPPSVTQRGSARPSSARQYALELELLEPARRGVARGDFGRALEAIARHRREFPSGQLAEERAALQVRALGGLGRAAEAEAAAAAFRQHYPRSALLGGPSAARPRTP